MDDKSLQILEFPQIKQILAGFTSFSASRQLALDIKPSSDYRQVTSLLQQSAEARHLLEIDPTFTIGGVVDIRESAKMASLGRVLEPQELLEVQGTLTAVSKVRDRLAKLADDLPLLGAIASGLVDLNAIATSIASCISPNGQVVDSASSQLSGIRRQLREVRQRLHERLEGMMDTPRGRRIIQEPVITEREGRYVIPVKIEYRNEMKGIVHDVSNTGATIFLEPLVTVDMGNTLREALTQEKREVERILRDLSIQVGNHEEEIARNIILMAELDLALAKARYARRLKAVEPSLAGFDGDGEPAPVERGGVLKLVDARHPLLGENAVPLSVEIGRDFSVLVITGPNTGGKTVALKTVGLLSVMAQCGMPIPARSESQIPIFDNIFADIGDEQSIEQTLSTFSWHVGNIVRILRHATEKSLVLLDELGTSTDPAEGAALAIAVLRRFLSRRTMTIATTHFSEIKAIAHATPGMRNASFDFDPVTLVPTYHLTVGVPGGSNALAVATRLGLPQDIIDEARRLLPEGIREIETLLLSLKTRERELSDLLQRLDKERSETARQRQELDKERRRLESEVNAAVRDARDRINLEAAEIFREMKETLSALRKERSRERLEQARKTVAAVEERLKSGVLKSKGTAGVSIAPPDEVALAVGDIVVVREVGIRATVLSLSKERGEVEVQAGQTRLRLRLENVDKVGSADGQKAVEARPGTVTMAPRSVPRELDLRGKRAEEAKLALDRYLDQVSLANQREVRIIHGFGTGAVRQVVRETLTASPMVKSFRAGKQGEGGDGVTVVEL